jgi:hypothetical protein
MLKTQFHFLKKYDYVIIKFRDDFKLLVMVDLDCLDFAYNVYWE